MAPSRRLFVGLLSPLLVVGCSLSDSGDPAASSGGPAPTEARWSEVSHDGPLTFIAAGGLSGVDPPKGWNGENWWGTWGLKACAREPGKVTILDLEHDTAIEPVSVAGWLRVVPAAAGPADDLPESERDRRARLGTSLGSPAGQENRRSVTLASGTGEATYDGEITPLAGAVHEFAACDKVLEAAPYNTAEPFSEVWISVESAARGSHITASTLYYEHQGEEYGVRVDWQMVSCGKKPIIAFGQNVCP